MSAGVPRPAGRGRGRGLKTETSNEGPVGGVSGTGGGAASWGSGNLGAPLVTPSSGTAEDSEQFVIDWDSINANREESEKARFDS